jgi:two-component system chemotaxis sensor kinase CheA
VDPARYLALFVEEATDHLGEMGRALLGLEKDPASADALELCFRMAHSIKGMAAAMRFAPLAERAHALEDTLSAARTAGRVEPASELPRLFAELDVLERLVQAIRDTGKCPAEPAPPSSHAGPAGLKKKLRTTPRAA